MIHDRTGVCPMKKARWWFAVPALLAAAGCAQNPPRQSADSAPSQAAPGRALAGMQPLFIIERSKNANTVHYDARLTAEGELDPTEPVIAYWVMRADDGRRKELNWIEKNIAYGFEIKLDPSIGGYIMTMVATPQRPIIVKKAGSAVHAELVIDGHPAIVEKMYINASDGDSWPQVHSIELYGTDVQTAEKRFERIMSN